ncbi:muts domain V-domain-containing protein [Dipodascopsis uninucleata]
MPSQASKSDMDSSPLLPAANKKQRTLTTFFSARSKLPQKEQSTIVNSRLDSDPFVESDDPRRHDSKENEKLGATLPSPVTPSEKSVSKSEKKHNISGTVSPSRRARKAVNYAEDSDSDEYYDANARKKEDSRKKRKISLEDDSEDDFTPEDKEDDGDEEDYDDILDVVDEAEDDQYVEDEDAVDDNSYRRKPNKKTTKTKAASVLASKFSASSTYRAQSSPNQRSRDLLVSKPASASKSKSFEAENEERYSWLVNVRDADGNPVGHPDYDPRTLFIPKSAWAKFTAFETQYWDVKSKMFDTVVFFKKGKFYELYERDADIAHTEFDLKLAGGGRANMRLAGVPEMSFDHWASSFIAKGYKVAKVDQVETMLGKEMRERGKKEDKIIKRELSCVLTAGTLVDETMLMNEMSTFCVAIKESATSNLMPLFGVCFVDTATGAFNLTEFSDDSDYNMLQTVIAQIRPKELILEKGIISPSAIRVIKNNTSTGTIWNYLKPRVEFWDEIIALEELTRGEYFPAETLDDQSQWPNELLAIMEKPTVMSALGGMLWYLRSLKIDKELVSLGNFSSYDPVKRSTSLVLNGQSLQNLEIFANSFDGGADGTLFKLLNRCITPFGKRLLRNWVCHPLQAIDSINARLDAVDTLNQNFELLDTLETGLTSIPDLERMVSRIHAGKCKVKDFVRVIEGFEQIYELVVKLRTDFELTGIFKILLDNLPVLDTCLLEWRDAFDRMKAKNENILVPEVGVEDDFDNSHANIKRIEDEFTEILRRYRREFRSQEITYRDSGKEIYLIEVPSRLTNAIPKDWQQLSATQKIKRYWSPEVRSLVRELLEARETHKQISSEMQLRFYARFDKSYNIWLKAIQLASNLDCLMSLAKTSCSLGYPSSRPTFIDSGRSVLKFEELRHPCFAGDNDFIPNDIILGGDMPKLTLLTGANAAGKSTILRMTCIAVIMAQVGCYVPAASASLTPVDCIMTRLGAQDNIFAGQSTFYVELSETKKILDQATDRSLLVLDELGRGGSSSDGFAIAESVLYHIATHIGSLGFFATHYGTLASSFESHPEVCAKRMAILVDDENRNVTFLYRLENGVSPGSFGMHVAAMCGVDKSIIDQAEYAAKELEHTSQVKKLMETTEDGHLISLGLQSDFSWLMKLANGLKDASSTSAFNTILEQISSL